MGEIIDTFGVDWRLLAVQAVNFGLLLLVLWYFLYRPLIRLLNERRKKIEEGVANAEQAEKRLAEMDGERVHIVSDATKHAGILVEQAKHRAQEKTDEIVRDAHAKSEQILTDARARAEESKRQALEESKTEIAKMAVLGAEKILREKTQSS